MKNKNEKMKESRFTLAKKAKQKRFKTTNLYFQIAKQKRSK